MGCEPNDLFGLAAVAPGCSVPGPEGLVPLWERIRANCGLGGAAGAGAAGAGLGSQPGRVGTARRALLPALRAASRLWAASPLRAHPRFLGSIPALGIWSSSAMLSLMFLALSEVPALR